MVNAKKQVEQAVDAYTDALETRAIAEMLWFRTRDKQDHKRFLKADAKVAETRTELFRSCGLDPSLALHGSRLAGSEGEQS